MIRLALARRCSLVAVLFCISAASLADPSPPQTASVTFTQIPMDAPEIVNPLRGYYQWHGGNSTMEPSPAANSYARFNWRDLEPSEGVYDFSKIEKGAAHAKAQGMKFGFRVTPLNTKSCVPDYLMAEMPNGFWADIWTPGQHVYVPDWNDPHYIARTVALCNALAARYDGDPRIAWIDIGSYGDWGEWHCSKIPYVKGGAAQPGTVATKQAIIDAYFHAFHKTRLLSMTDDHDGVIYAMSLSPKIGLRRDSLTHAWFANGLQHDPAKFAAMQDRWKTAPFITELYSSLGQDSDYERGVQQVPEFHVSAISYGNLGKYWAAMDTDGQNAVQLMGKEAGYRYAVSAARYPAEIRPGDKLTTELDWMNSGDAPVYDPWTVTLELQDPATRAVVWSGASQLDLTTLLPNDVSQTVTDTFHLPRSIKTGAYTLAFTVIDPTGYYPPLGLAIQGRQVDGSYAIGTVEVK